mgnify:CR=1 FL=1
MGAKEAVAILGNVPAESTCVDKTIRPLKTYFASYIDFDCKQKLNLARNIWSANQNIESANEAARLLINVNPFKYIIIKKSIHIMTIFSIRIQLLNEYISRRP